MASVQVRLSLATLLRLCNIAPVAQSYSSKRLDEWLKKVDDLDAFAQAVGINRVSLWRYRRGDTMPSAASAGAIERATDGAVPANGWGSDAAAGVPGGGEAA